MKEGCTCHDRRSGFALLAVLWILTSIAILGLTMAVAAREAIAGSRNRMDLTRAAWLAEGCLDRARAVLDALLADSTGVAKRSVSWWRIDKAVASSHLLRGQPCEISMRPAGATMDVNGASADQLRAVFDALDLAPAVADSLADALLDWRDADDLPRSYGAETAWYSARKRITPRNSGLGNVKELQWVRGLEQMAGLESLFDIEPGRICLQHAGPVILAALPGSSAELVSHILRARAEGRLVDMSLITERLSRSARQQLEARYQDFLFSVTMEPDAWLLTSRARIGSPPVTAGVQVKLLRAGARAAIVRRKTWIE